MEKKELLSEVAEITAKTLVSTIPVGEHLLLVFGILSKQMQPIAEWKIGRIKLRKNYVI